MKASTTQERSFAVVGGWQADSVVGTHAGRDSFGFNASLHALGEAEAFHQGTGLRVMSMELLCDCRGDLRPDPAEDAIRLIYLGLQTDTNPPPLLTTYILFLNPPSPCKFSPWRAMAKNVHTLEDEIALIQLLIDIIRREDPDILMGYDIQRESWGYLLERGRTLGMELGPLLSRIPQWETGSGWSTEERWWSMAEMSICGRIVLNLWRLLRHEAALRSYRLESTAFHLLHVRVPYIPHQHLARWILNTSSCGVAVEQLKLRVKLSLDLLTACDILNRTTEMARVYGIQFFEVLSRGSQFRVESMLLRLTRERGYAAPSPSPRLRSKMAAPECIALTLEPESAFYTDPVLVLDFQSLYPSLIIAYNYCYSTCLGKLSAFSEDHLNYKLGCLEHGLSEDEVRSVGPVDVHFSPAGVGFVKAHVRRGVMPTMLEDILATRLMVKDAMKRADDSSLKRLLDARQMALKLIANVTYGYTSANFSGRMPCVEVADSIVHKGREALEAAIALVNSTHEWRARVVYGDTDSIFVQLPGRSKAEAFEIGKEIAAAVTASNPKPMKLKFEKVFYPCVLQTKKRYVGYAYESPDQVEPTFDAKGIETVRRDSIPLVNKVLERTLRLLFSGEGVKGLGIVRDYLVRTFGKVRSGRIALPEFVFAREFRGVQGYQPTAVVPALKIYKERRGKDPRSGPLISERVEYVIGTGPPTASLFSCVREPAAFLRNPKLRLNYHYYLKGVLVPPLQRVLGLMGVNVEEWLEEARYLYPAQTEEKAKPGAVAAPSTRSLEKRSNSGRLSQYYEYTTCLICSASCLGGLCEECSRERELYAVSAGRRCGEAEGRYERLLLLCRTCARTPTLREPPCEALQCPVLHSKLALAGQARRLRRALDILQS